MRKPAAALFFLAGSYCAYGADSDAMRKRGEALVRANCAACHATDATQLSPHREAPPFRTLSERYPIDFLAEALAEGLSTGHPDMPEFVFNADDVAAILAFVKSIQEAPAKGR